MWFDYPVHNFNSHAHVERDVRVTVGKEIIVDNFNSHAHVERDGHAYADFRRCEHFNSHAHVERDPAAMSLRLMSYISTHTLTWSVTRKLFGMERLHRISTHTLTWSVTINITLCILPQQFQLTRSRGA